MNHNHPAISPRHRVLPGLAPARPEPDRLLSPQGKHSLPGERCMPGKPGLPGERCKPGASGLPGERCMPEKPGLPGEPCNPPQT